MLKIIFNDKNMILNIFRKYTEINKRKKIIITIIEDLNINEKQKQLYLDSLDYLDEVWLEKLYKGLEMFMDQVEKKEFEDISNNNFSNIAWLRKKEAIEKQKELNSFWFLLNNL